VSTGHSAADHDRTAVADGQSGALATQLLDAEPLRAPAMATLVDTIGLPAGSCGIDVGCGLGLQAQLLTERLGDRTTVHGVDRDAAIVALGARRLDGALARRIHFTAGETGHLPYRSAEFDWAWSVDCVGYPAGDMAAALREMSRVTRPGGLVVVAGWSAQRVLPGHSMLEARLDATCSAYAPYLDAFPPTQHFTNGLAAFRSVGLVDVRVRTIVHDVAGPLSPALRTALESLIDMLWTPPTEAGGAAAWAELARLRAPPPPRNILDHDGYHAWFAYTAFVGTVLAPNPERAS
jgi:demethylmenaquinone methyltransferase/2-methoxy-6-polyprenyl-1,4-benzoquinol methylase